MSQVPDGGSANPIVRLDDEKAGLRIKSRSQKTDWGGAPTWRGTKSRSATP